MAEDADLKGLPRTPGRSVFMPPRADELERSSECLAKHLSVVAHHWQSAARIGTVESKSGNDGMATCSQSLCETHDVGIAVRSSDEKMECRAVVPYIVDARWLPCRDIGNNP